MAEGIHDDGLKQERKSSNNSSALCVNTNAYLCDFTHTRGSSRTRFRWEWRRSGMCGVLGTQRMRIEQKVEMKHIHLCQP